MQLPIVWVLGVLEQTLMNISACSVNGACGLDTSNMLWLPVDVFVTLHFFLPLTLVIFLYGHMIIRLRSTMGSEDDNPSRRRNDVMEKR